MEWDDIQLIVIKMILLTLIFVVGLRYSSEMVLYAICLTISWIFSMAGIIYHDLGFVVSE